MYVRVCVCVQSFVAVTYCSLSLLTDDVWSNEKSDYERAKRESEKMRRVEQQEREENLFNPKKKRKRE
jgi:hypothetical protein